MSQQLVRWVLPAAVVLGAFVGSPGRLPAQDASGRCATADSVVVRGNVRVEASRIRTEAGITQGM
ncbi:MAG: hypothetical protein K2Y26_05410, partial [Gemmatimonadaceae bacterium]|nr:hypothetical protein [Gemmatimonadaceae bacterium]